MSLGDDDLLVFVSDFGRVVTYTRRGAGPVTLRGNFDSPAMVGSTFNEAPGLVEQGPQLVLPSADLPAEAGEGDSLSIAGDSRSFRVTAILSDGTGVTRLTLEVV